MQLVRNETLFSEVRGYTVIDAVVTPDEHNSMHGKLADSDTEHPHSFVFHPIHELHNDLDSDIVAVAAGVVAWDAALLDLLPEGIIGIHCVLVNNCGQTFTYELGGRDALFQGKGDLHDPAYDKYERFVNLALNAHPETTATTGHCQYGMVRVDFWIYLLAKKFLGKG